MQHLSAIFLFALSTSITPGPNNIMVMTSGLNHGLRKTTPHYLGICLGFPAMVLAIGLGLGAIFMQLPMLHKIIKIVGIGYLLYLAWLIAKTKPELAESGKPLSFMQAVLFQWVNPKAWIMAMGAVATYTSLDGNILTEVAIITGIYLLVLFPAVGSWFLCGSRLQLLIKSPRQQRAFNICMALLLVSSVLPMLRSQF